MKILVAQPVDGGRLAEIQARLPKAVIDCRDPLGPEDEVATDYMVLFSDRCPANVAELTSLRWIQLGSAGYEQIIGQPLAPDTLITNASGVNDIPIAEWCLLMMLSFARDFTDILDRQRAHQWDRDQRFQAELRGATVGILGYGNIGRQVASLSRAVGLRVWACSRSGVGTRPDRFLSVDCEPDRAFALDELPTFLAGLDYLVITAPLTDSTRGLLGTAELSALPTHAVLLNPARAGIVDEQALLDALHAGTLRGAALDSHYREPMAPDDPIWEAPRTVVTPHVSGSNGTHFLDRLWDLFGQNVDRFSAGRPLLNDITAVRR